ncbi:MAG: geranylgeranylglycerol-phosphate geranylgeranyltransferase [Candidatus Cyclobacteriaceae bacterium M3_2C_046]
MNRLKLRRRYYIRLIAFLRLIRVQNLLIIFLTQYLVAIFLIGTSDNWWLYLFDPGLFLLSFSTLLIAAAGYIINDYYDIKIDYINKPHRVIVGRLIKRRHALFIHLSLNILAVLTGIFLSLWIGFIYAITAFLLWFYSNHLKRLPFIGNLLVSFLTGLSLFILALYYRENEILIYVYAVFAFGITLIREIIKDMEDLKGDANFGCRTLPVIWGIRKVKILIYILIVLFTTFSFLIMQQLENAFLNIYFLLFFVPVMGIFIAKLARSDSKRSFSYLSSYCKGLMLSGILSMIFF